MTDILVIVFATTSRRWQGELVERLEAAGHRVGIRHSRAMPPNERPLDLVLSLEARRFGPSLADAVAPPAERQLPAPHLVIDLTGSEPAGAAPVLTLLFSGHHGMGAGVETMLASRQLPEFLTLLDGVPVGRARPMVGDRLWLSRASTEVLGGALSLLEQSVGRFAAGRLKPIDAAVPPAGPGPGRLVGRYLPLLVGGLVRRSLRKLRHRPFYWQVGYRLIDGPGVAETGRLDGVPFTLLPDDGRRFYADPFAFAHEGRHFIFVEEFPYAQGKGVLSVAELGADGVAGAPRPIIEEAHHLSYPQVFAADGEVWMIPEGSGARELVLYRAEAFPQRWVRDTVLVSGSALNDMTLLRHGGRLWLLGTERRGRGSASDTMVVYSADTLRGPWRPHALNPVAIDRSAARPGGAFLVRDGHTVLPVQDGSAGYGGGLGLMPLQQLDDTEVVFGPPVPVQPGPAWPHGGLHTLSRAGRLEVIDSASARSVGFTR